MSLYCWRRLLRVPWAARRSSQSILKKSVLNIHWKDWCWRWSSITLTMWWEELTHWKRPWCWARLKAEGEGTREGEMIGWHHRFDGHEFKQSPEIGDGQGSLVCCSPWGCKELDMPEGLNWTSWALPTEGKGPHLPTQIHTSFCYNIYFNVPLRLVSMAPETRKRIEFSSTEDIAKHLAWSES